MNIPAVDQALANARTLAATHPLGRAQGNDHGRTFSFVRAGEYQRVARMVFPDPRVNLVLRARGGEITPHGLVRHYRLTHLSTGETDEWSTTTPLDAHAPRDLAASWARTHSLTGVLRDLLWPEDADETPDPSERRPTGPVEESRTQAQIQEDTRRNGRAPLYDRNERPEVARVVPADASMEEILDLAPGDGLPGTSLEALVAKTAALNEAVDRGVQAVADLLNNADGGGRQTPPEPAPQGVPAAGAEGAQPSAPVPSTDGGTLADRAVPESPGPVTSAGLGSSSVDAPPVSPLPVASPTADPEGSTASGSAGHLKMLDPWPPQTGEVRVFTSEARPKPRATAPLSPAATFAPPAPEEEPPSGAGGGSQPTPGDVLERCPLCEVPTRTKTEKGERMSMHFECAGCGLKPLRLHNRELVRLAAALEQLGAWLKVAPLCRECKTTFVDVEGVVCQRCIDGDAPLDAEDDPEAEAAQKEIDETSAKVEAGEACPSCFGVLVDGKCLDEGCDVDDAAGWLAEQERADFLAHQGGMGGPLVTPAPADFDDTWEPGLRGEDEPASATVEVAPEDWGDTPVPSTPSPKPAYRPPTSDFAGKATRTAKADMGRCCYPGEGCSGEIKAQDRYQVGKKSFRTHASCVERERKTTEPTTATSDVTT